MIPVNLKKLISKKEVYPIVNDIINTIDNTIAIQDADGRFLMGKDSKNLLSKYPVELSGKVIGWVIGGEKSSTVASLLTHIAGREFEKKTLARETLDKYKELILLYDISDKITACLDLEEVARLIINKAKKLIEADNASIMLLNEETEQLEIIAASGNEYNPKITLRPGEGIAGSILLTKIADIINDVISYPKYIKGANKISSMMCAPLKIKDRVIGVINISSEERVNYSAEDLKLFTALASQAASAIENAVLHKSKLNEERIKGNLERYISPQIVRAIMEAKEDIPIHSAKRNITILFSDIRNFSSTCEKLKPEEIVGYLNEYFTAMVEVIFNHGGTINQFTGDGFMSLFGAPINLVENEKRAIEAAIRMQKCLKTMPVPWIRENFNTGIGINSGVVVVGNIGSPQRLDYTAVGDDVIITDRLQSIAKGGQILTTRNVYNVTKDTFEFKSFGNINVKGKKKSVEVFEVVY
jgi:class 3 adenylate cyclase